MDDLETQRAASLAAKRAANREAYPSVAAIVDEFEAVFDKLKVLGGRDDVSGKEFGWNPPPSPACDSCTGHDGGAGCEWMDSVAYGHDAPDPERVFCGHRMRIGPVEDGAKRTKR